MPIEVDLARCSGCRSCEVACSFHHSGRVGRLTARIRVSHLYETGVDGPVVCVQCVERYCLECPASALRVGELGQVIASPTRCEACGKCARRCPIGAIEVQEGLAYVCDLCDGDPACVAACELGALAYQSANGGAPSLAGRAAGVKRLQASERRRAFVADRAADLRQRWRSRDA